AKRCSSSSFTRLAALAVWEAMAVMASEMVPAEGAAAMGGKAGRAGRLPGLPPAGEIHLCKSVSALGLGPPAATGETAPHPWTAGAEQVVLGGQVAPVAWLEILQSLVRATSASSR